MVGTSSDNNNIHDSEGILGQGWSHVHYIPLVPREVVDRHDGHNRWNEHLFQPSTQRIYCLEVASLSYWVSETNLCCCLILSWCEWASLSSRISAANPQCSATHRLMVSLLCLSLFTSFRSTTIQAALSSSMRPLFPGRGRFRGAKLPWPFLSSTKSSFSFGHARRCMCSLIWPALSLHVARGPGSHKKYTVYTRGSVGPKYIYTCI